MNEEMRSFDVSQFETVRTANAGIARPQDFRLKMNTGKCTFTFSNELFAELSLATNSVTQFNKFDDPDRGIYLMVLPGNEGVWLKKKQGSEKGKTHKNEKIVEALARIGITNEKLDLTQVGVASGFPMYKIVLDPAYTVSIQDTEADTPQHITYSSGTDPISVDGGPGTEGDMSEDDDPFIEGVDPFADLVEGSTESSDDTDTTEESTRT